MKIVVNDARSWFDELPEEYGEDGYGSFDATCPELIQKVLTDSEFRKEHDLNIVEIPEEATDYYVYTKQWDDNPGCGCYILDDHVLCVIDGKIQELHTLFGHGHVSEPEYKYFEED